MPSHVPRLAAVKALVAVPLLALATTNPARGDHDRLDFAASPDAGEPDLTLGARAVHRVRFEVQRHGLVDVGSARELRREFGQRRAEQARRRMEGSGPP